MDKVLVVFYSYTGTCRQLARSLCAQLDWPVGEIVDAHSRAGPTGTLRCVADTLLRRRPLIRYDGPDPKAFDAVVLVSPIWVYGLAGPMRSFIVEHASDFRRVAVISVMGSQGASNAVAEIGRLLAHPPALAAAFTSREVEDGSCACALEAFGHVLQGMGAYAPSVPGAGWTPRAA
jgi:menaquinone-dependent protoporphyrinogen IX oxidase